MGWIFLLSANVLAAWGQIDPELRQLVQLGYYQPLVGKSPMAGYVYYYDNRPLTLKSNIFLRLAIAPVYLDSELGLVGALGSKTDLGIGVSGGGFAESYSEIRQGRWIERESFLGHNGGASLSLYHRFNPTQLIPLFAVVRAGFDHVFYESDDTAPDFRLPDDHTDFRYRVGLRLGGQEPVMQPPLALEISLWYEEEWRTVFGRYGFAGDREMKSNGRLVWARCLARYTWPDKKHRLGLSATLGASPDADRMSAFRLGGFLPLSSEFPLDIPGYYFQEISADRFVLFNGNYTVPLDSQDRFHLGVVAATGFVDYLPGLEQPGHWHSGLGGAMVYTSKSGVWQLCLTYGFGWDAVRSRERGAHAVGLLCQIDLEARHRYLAAFPTSPVSPHKARGFNWLFRH